MTHHRERFERVYALTEAVAPAHLICEGTEAEADRFLIKKEVSFCGLARLNQVGDSFLRDLPSGTVRQIRQALVAEGDLTEVQVQGWKTLHCVLSSDIELLSAVDAGRVPQAWAPLETTTSEEVLFLAPLDHVSARGRAKVLFGFDYVWEVYKPEQRRSYGYYTLPVLWGDRLVARFDSKLDRTSNTFVVLGLWLEDAALGGDAAFAEALARGFARFATFLGTSTLDVTAIREPLLRQHAHASVRNPRGPAAPTPPLA